MYLLQDKDYEALVLVASAVQAAVLWPAKDHAAALEAATHDLRIILENTVKDEPIGYIYGKDTP